MNLNSQKNSQPIDLNKLDKIIDLANKNMEMCDEECKKNKLESEYVKAKANLNLAEPNYEIAKKNYYQGIYGNEKYNELIEKEAIAESNVLSEKLKQIILPKLKQIDSLKKATNITTNYNENSNTLFNTYLNKKTDLITNLQNNYNDIFTNERKTYYENQTYMNAIYFLNILFIIYYLLVFYYGYLSIKKIMFNTNGINSISSSSSNTFIVVLKFICVLLLPYVIMYCLRILLTALNWLSNFIPKNVYL